MSLPFDGLERSVIGTIVAIGLILMLGYNGRGFITRFARERREGRTAEATAEVDLLERIRSIAGEELQRLSDRVRDLEAAREVSDRRYRLLEQRVTLYQGRVIQLEGEMRGAGLPVPPWTTVVAPVMPEEEPT